MRFGRGRNPNSERIVLVANDVGGVGGMERQLGQLVVGLLSLGQSVTVIARTCRVEVHDDLHFIRVRCPARPFSVAFPAFFVLASLHALRHKDGLLHTTGAIIANRADVSTVHYCHATARTALAVPRASRASLPYRLNARLAELLSDAAERWCYRPARTKLLCAVSGGLASELRHAFPRMAPRVRQVANGVDVCEFRPNAAVRRAIRGELEIDDGALVALFAGGDWDRKGLRYAVQAAAEAPDWELIVAGEGDADGVRRHALETGVAERLHLLGTVAEMAPIYAAADVLVLPTAYETFSLVTYEAAASELALLVTRVSGVEDLLRDGVNGWFIERNADNIAARLSSLAHDRSLMREMGLRARIDARSFSWAQMVAGYQRAYREVAKVER